ncbi:MAG TPA: carboxypeptidase regulatory-like domain-containing protein [Anaeromyxobacteraceae bacterium]|nr:carboxypeptidase regulatory-like domain-containing protein [Anaeromyxobacteraceae bacterium]
MGSNALRTLSAAALLVSAPGVRAAGGTVSGKVDVTPPKYAAETVVYLKGVAESPQPRTLAMDQKNMTFIPHVLVVAKGDTVKFLNHDGVGHNVYSPDGDAYNLGTFKQNEDRTHKFDQEGPYSQLCSIHPEMLGYIFVAPSRFAAAVDPKGRFTIADVPPGSYKLAVWNSHLKAPDQPVTVTAGGTTEVNVTVKR